MFHFDIETKYTVFNSFANQRVSRDRSNDSYPIDSFNDIEFIIIIIILLVPCNDYSAASRLRKILSDEDIFVVITVNQINVVKAYYS